MIASCWREVVVMTRSKLINILTITVVVSIFCFAGMCIIGYSGIPGDLLENARSRQTQPLLEIPEPERLKPQPIEAVPTETVMPAPADTDALVQELLPRLADELALVLAERLQSGAQVDQAQLIADIQPQLETALLAQLEPRLVARVEDYLPDLEALLLVRLEPELVARAEGYLPELEAILLKDLEPQLVARAESYMPQLEVALLADLESQFVAKAEAYIPQLVDALIPQIVPQVVATLETRLDSYMPTVAEALKPYFDYLTMDDLTAAYEQYKPQVVKDLVPLIVPEVLDAIESSFVSSVSQVVAEPAPSSPAMPTVAQPVVSAEPAAVPAAPTSITPKWSIPDVDEGASVYLDPDAYAVQRDALRQQEIQKILDMLQD